MKNENYSSDESKNHSSFFIFHSLFTITSVYRFHESPHDVFFR